MRAPDEEIRVSASPSPFRLDGKLALVTGAGRGIGRAIALALGQAGAELLLNSRTPAELAAVAAEIEAQGGRARPLPFDVTDSPAARGAIGGLTRLHIPSPPARPGTGEGAATPSVCLAPPAASLVTGSSRLVEGGWTAW